MVATFPLPSIFDQSLPTRIAQTKQLIEDLMALPPERANQWAFNKGYQDAADWVAYLKADLSDLAKQ